MSFSYNGVVVTINNYMEVFGGCTPDIADEVRSAVLDDTPVGPYIKCCGQDSYKLGQFRMALREYVPKGYLNKGLSGRCMNRIRMCHKEGVDMTSLLPYLKGSLKVPSENVEKILDAVVAGADIRPVDFTIVPDGILDVVCEGLVKGYPMWLCVSEGSTLSDSTVRQLMKGMQLQVDIHPFLDGSWGDDQIVFLLSHARSVDVNSLLSHVNGNFSVDHLIEVVDAARLGLPYDVLCAKDEDGMPVYNEYQLAVLREALASGVQMDRLLDSGMNDMDMRDLLDSLLEEKEKARKPVLGGKMKRGKGIEK